MKSISKQVLHKFFIFDESENKYTCKIAKTPEEIQALIENGFEYTCKLDGLKFFRKRK
jgi:hypothetical protein